MLGVGPNVDGIRQNGAIARVKWGQEAKADEFEEVALVNPQQQHPQLGANHLQNFQEPILNRRAKSGGGGFGGMPNK